MSCWRGDRPRLITLKSRLRVGRNGRGQPRLRPSRKTPASSPFIRNLDGGRRFLSVPLTDPRRACEVHPFAMSVADLERISYPPLSLRSGAGRWRRVRLALIAGWRAGELDRQLAAGVSPGATALLAIRGRAAHQPALPRARRRGAGEGRPRCRGHYARLQRGGPTGPARGDRRPDGARGAGSPSAGRRAGQRPGRGHARVAAHRREQSAVPAHRTRSAGKPAARGGRRT